METITLKRKEYNALVEAKRKLDAVLRSSFSPERRGEFLDAAFGILKKALAGRESAAYVSRLRKAWRA